jgi:hypothetical protein
MRIGKFSRAWSAARKATPHAVCDLAGFSGAALISYGAWLIYPPAGFIVGGLLLMAFAMLVGRRLDAGKE